MNRFTAGMIAGGVIGAIGLTYAFSDKRARRRAVRDSRRAFDKAGNFIGNIADKF